MKILLYFYTSVWCCIILYNAPVQLESIEQAMLGENLVLRKLLVKCGVSDLPSHCLIRSIRLADPAASLFYDNIGIWSMAWWSKRNFMQKEWIGTLDWPFSYWLFQMPLFPAWSLFAAKLLWICLGMIHLVLSISPHGQLFFGVVILHQRV